MSVPTSTDRLSGPSLSAVPRPRSSAPAPGSSAAPAPQEPGRANLDPNDDDIVGPPDPIPDCESRLSAAGIEFKVRSLPVHRERGIQCGTPQAVEYRSGPAGIRWRPAPIVSCGLALALGRFERVLKDESERDLGVSIVSVEQGGTYSCRPMQRFRLVSEHSYANGIDVRSFRTRTGRTITVLEHFGKPGREPSTAEGRFLRQLAHRLYDEDVFSVVVTRLFDELHRDHIHVDLARYRVDGSR